MNYPFKWSDGIDPATIPDEVLRSEFARRNIQRPYRFHPDSFALTWPAIEIAPPRCEDCGKLIGVEHGESRCLCGEGAYYQDESDPEPEFSRTDHALDGQGD